MKKVGVVLLAIFPLVYFSCKKEAGLNDQMAINAIKENTKSGKSYLSGNAKYLQVSREGLDSIFNSDSVSQSIIINETNIPFEFISYSKYLTENNIVDNSYNGNILFPHLINKDQVIQVNKYIYKFDPSIGKVFVLKGVLNMFYSDLINEDLTNKNIEVFNIIDDVISMLENRDVPPPTNPQESRLFCRESGIGQGSDDGGIYFKSDNTVKYNNRYLKCNVEYDKQYAGLYHNLFAEGALYAVVYWPKANDYTTDHIINNESIRLELAPVYYHIRCGSTIGPYNTSKTGYSIVKYQSYQGSKHLNQLYFRARTVHVGLNVSTSWQEIRKNY